MGMQLHGDQSMQYCKFGEISATAYLLVHKCGEISTTAYLLVQLYIMKLWQPTF